MSAARRRSDRTGGRLLARPTIRLSYHPSSPCRINKIIPRQGDLRFPPFSPKMRGVQTTAHAEKGDGMKALFTRLFGGKTRFFATCAMALTLAQQVGLTHLTPEQYEALMTLFGGGAIHGLRD